MNWNDGLSEQEAVSLGLWRSPAYQELLADLQITEADIIQASQLQNPQFTTMFPLGPKQWEFTLNLPLDVLWLRPIRVAAAELESNRVAERLLQDGLNTVRDIRVAYIDWQTAHEREQLLKRIAALRNELARMAQARLDAGDVAELDVAAMRLEATVSSGDSIRAKYETEFALQRLRYLLGMQMSDQSLGEPAPSHLPRIPSVGFDVNELASEATSLRPDLRASQWAMNAAQQRAELARRDIWQVIGVLPDINSQGRKGFEAGPGLQMSVPIFHQNQGAIERALADYERLSKQYINRRDLASMEVRQAYARLMQSAQDVKIWRDKVVPHAQASLESAQKALLENAVDPVLVLQMTSQLVAAEQRELDARAQFQRAVAELERSVGRRLFDYTGDSLIHPEVIPAAPDDAPPNDALFSPPEPQ